MPTSDASFTLRPPRSPDEEHSGGLARFAEKMGDAKARMRLYALCAAGLYVIALMLMAVKVRHGINDRVFDFAPADGKFYYVYIVSAVTEGSLDPGPAFRHWHYAPDPKAGVDIKGRPRNVYPIGVSLAIAPPFLVAHLLSKIAYAVTGNAHFVPDGYSILYQLLNLAWLMLASWATFVLLDRLMVRFFGLRGVAIAIGVLGAYIGTQYTYHLLRFPLMSVVFAPFFATGLVYCAATAADKIRRTREVGWHWTGMAICFAMVFECRNTNVIWSLFGLVPLFLVIREGLLLQLLKKQFPWMLLCLFPIVLQMLVWHNQFGHYLTASYGDTAQFYWTHPAFWQEMFSLRAGMLVWCPVWTMGMVGAIIYLRSRPSSAWIVGCYLLTFLIIWYVNSSYWAWPFSNYPNRGFVEWIGLPTLGLSLLFHHNWQARSRTQWLVALLLAGVCITWLLSAAYDTRHVRRYGDEVNAMGPIGAQYAR